MRLTHRRHLWAGAHAYRLPFNQCLSAASWEYSMCPPQAVADPGFLKGDFSFSLTKTPAQFELKTKIKVINLHAPFSFILLFPSHTLPKSCCLIIAFRSDYSIKVFKLTGLKSISKGVSMEMPLTILLQDSLTRLQNPKPPATEVW